MLFGVFGWVITIRLCRVTSRVLRGFRMFWRVQRRCLFLESYVIMSTKCSCAWVHTTNSAFGLYTLQGSRVFIIIGPIGGV